MELSLKGRTALVSGASAGIGSGIAQVLAAEGARIAITARRHDLLEQLASKISGSGAEAPVVVTGDPTGTMRSASSLKPLPRSAASISWSTVPVARALRSPMRRTPTGTRPST